MRARARIARVGPARPNVFLLSPVRLRYYLPLFAPEPLAKSAARPDSIVVSSLAAISRRFQTSMSKSLIIAEKPSVAADIARALGGFTRHGDYFESDRHVLSSAVGHLLEIGMPEAEEVKRGKWTFAQLPAIPSHFALKPIEKNEIAPEDAAEAHQAQGRHRAHQCLRRRARGRAHLPQHRSVREVGQARSTGSGCSR